MVRSIAFMLLASLTVAIAPVEGADSAVGKVFGFGACVQDRQLLLAAFAFPVLALILVIVVRWRNRQTPGPPRPKSS